MSLNTRWRTRLVVPIALVIAGIAGAVAVGWVHENVSWLPRLAWLHGAFWTVVVFAFLLQEHRKSRQLFSFRVALFALFVVHCGVLAAAIATTSFGGTWLLPTAIAEMFLLNALLENGGFQ